MIYDQIQWGRQVGLMPEDGSGGDRALKGASNARVKLARAVQARRSTS